MRILMIGDIFGRRGRETVKKLLPGLKKEKDIQLVIANCENLSHGKGATLETIQEMKQSGIDFFTSGNHIWHSSKDLINKLSDKKFPVLRPANYPEGNIGRGHEVIEAGLMKRILVINLQGRVFMPDGVDSPFQKVDRILQEYDHDNNISAIVVDFHAETTSEKNAMRHYLDGRVSALVGTHTHVQTNDALVTAKGTAYVTDIGLTGVYENSVIGIEKNCSLDLFLMGNITRWEPAEGDTLFQAVLIDIDDRTKKAVSIEIIKIAST